MPTKKKRLSQSADVVKSLQGKAPPRNVVKDALATMHQRRESELDKVAANQRQLTKHFEQVQTLPSINTKDPSVVRSLNALLSQHEKYAKQKLAVPKVLQDVGALFPGHIAVNAVPPFDFDHVLFGSGTGSNIATRTASANRLNGQIDVSASLHPTKGLAVAAPMAWWVCTSIRLAQVILRCAPRLSFHFNGGQTRFDPQRSSNLMAMSRS